MSDVTSVFIWWLVIFVFGLIFFPASNRFFSRFIDRGYLFAKVIGIVISSYLIWLLSSLGLLPFAKITLIIYLLCALFISLWFYKEDLKKGKFKSLHLGLFIFEEIIFLIGLGVWSYVKAHEPTIHGLEKFMDFGFVNSILKTSYFPPLDMWLTKSPDYSGGYFINYYYFGHYMTAFLTKLSGIDPAVTYNLMIATLFAFTFTLSMSLGINLVHFFNWENMKGSYELLKNKIGLGKWIKLLAIGLMTGYIVSLGGNLHTLYSFTTGYPNETPVPPWKLSFGYHPDRYWYPNATRFIPFTIHEFPAYSFVVSDLHGHVSDIPLVFLTLALLLSFIIDKNKAFQTKINSQDETPTIGGRFKFATDFENHTFLPLGKLLFLGVLLAAMYMTNAWDGLIYLILSGMVFLYLNFSAKFRENQTSFYDSLYRTFSGSLFLLFFFLLASLPFSLNFKPFASGIGVLCAPKTLLDIKKIGPLLFEVDKCQKSPLYMLTILWGFFYFHVASFLIFILVPKMLNRNNKTSENKKLAAGLITHFKKIGSSLLKPLQLFHQLTVADSFVLLMIIISTLLLIFPEFFYLKDIYPAHYRANTMFKLGYQAFMMLGLATIYIIYRIKTSVDRSVIKIIFTIMSIITIFLVAIYPNFAVNSYFGNLKIYSGLDGLKWLKNQYPDDYNAIIWLRNNINCNNSTPRECNSQPVIAEANGESYTDYARVSANTGLPTIIGWPVHEWLWRGSYDEAGKRIPEVAVIYESKDINAVKNILRKYSVAYIFVGTLEKDKYPNLNETGITSVGDIVFQSGNTKIYKVKILF